MAIIQIIIIKTLKMRLMLKIIKKVFTVIMQEEMMNKVRKVCIVMVALLIKNKKINLRRMFKKFKCKISNT